MRGKKAWAVIGSCLGMLMLILDSRTALDGAREGIELCLKTVIPSLLPFFVLSILLTGSLSGTNFPILRPLGRLFRMPQGAEGLLIPAFLGGYPVGAKGVALAWRNGTLTTSDAQRLLRFCGNAGPAFLFGMAAPLFPRRWMAWALWGIHIFSAMLVARLFPGQTGHARCLPDRGGTNLPEALQAALRVMASVCGWVVLFRVLIAFLSRWVLWRLPLAAQVTAAGLLELSNGCCQLALLPDPKLRFVLCAVFLAFGGVCVTMQTASVTEGLPLKSYLSGKLLQTALSFLMAVAVAEGLALPGLAAGVCLAAAPDIRRAFFQNRGSAKERSGV